MSLKSRVYKHGNQWRVDVPQYSWPVQLFEWQHAMDIGNEYARMAQFAERFSNHGPGWRELAADWSNQ